MLKVHVPVLIGLLLYAAHFFKPSKEHRTRIWRNGVSNLLRSHLIKTNVDLKE